MRVVLELCVIGHSTRGWSSPSLRVLEFVSYHPLFAVLRTRSRAGEDWTVERFFLKEQPSFRTLL